MDIRLCDLEAMRKYFMEMQWSEGRLHGRVNNWRYDAFGRYARTMKEIEERFRGQDSGIRIQGSGIRI